MQQAEMTEGLRVIERAFQLARSGAFSGVKELERALKKEGFDAVATHLHSTGLRKQLREACAAARQAVT